MTIFPEVFEAGVLLVGCPFCHPTNSIKAFKAQQYIQGGPKK